VQYSIVCRFAPSWAASRSGGHVTVQYSTVQDIARIVLDKAQYSTVYLQYTIETRRVQQLPYARVDAGRNCKNQVMGPNIYSSITHSTQA